MLTGGVDLAAEPKGTAFAVIAWRGDAAELVRLEVGVDDERIANAASGVAKLGIDCAFGWPDDFVEFLIEHSRSGRMPTATDAGIDRRRRLAYRATDRITREVTGRWPLSVATDRLGLTAFRCAELLERLQRDGHDVDRAGRGFVAEVYPGATLRLWGFDTRGYKTEHDRRRELLAELQAQAPWLDLGAYAQTMIAAHDGFDAVVAALAARACAIGAASVPPPGLIEQAAREGWIALPTGPISELGPAAPRPE